MKPVQVGILAGFDEGPFYYHVQKGRGTNWTIEEAAEHLGFSADLARELTAWDDEYQATLNLAVPQDSGFPTPEAKQAWIERGKNLAARLKRECPNVASVDYQANGAILDGECVF
ncbi:MULTISPECIES: hypothetical protein [Actinoalloteichus]|uniref:Uncharacterized protein n=1 Tax=Actinoalloteichus fjordicus TaxID=1612552 RepID=A0AAC9PTN1_9PSEU|nr:MULTISPECIES: hypothetical protein [Actinoalloteichus]APU16056.1 hypothetical protein UA74_20155 [Actinoalloteichus fjordicus]APU22122.1 hypothetical protein UA75_20665 [Actinoalloteichus sp. GBA129-24]